MHGVTIHLGMDIEGKGQSHNIAYVKDAIPTTGVGVLIYAMFWDWPFPSMPVSMWMVSGNIMMPKGHRYGPSMSMDLVASNNLLCYMLQWQLPAKCSGDDLNQVCSRDTFCGMLQQNGQQLRFFRMHRKQFFSACDICHMFCKAEFSPAADCSKYSACQELDHSWHLLGSTSASSAPCLQANPGRVCTMAV